MTGYQCLIPKNYWQYWLLWLLFEKKIITEILTNNLMVAHGARGKITILKLIWICWVRFVCHLNSPWKCLHEPRQPGLAQSRRHQSSSYLFCRAVPVNPILLLHSRIQLVGYTLNNPILLLHSRIQLVGYTLNNPILLLHSRIQHVGYKLNNPILLLHSRIQLKKDKH